jgi:hypothetical protein
LGPWAIKYYYFDYTSTKATGLTPVSSLAYDGSSPDAYVSMYAIVTNTYSKPLTILDGSYLQLVSPATDINFFITQSGYAAGTTTSGTTSTSLHDSNLGATPGSLVGLYLQYTSGPAAGRFQLITGNTATTITTAAFAPAPSSGGGDSFVVTPIHYSGSSATFTPYDCEDSEPSAPTGTACITLSPGQSVTLSFAACGVGSSTFEWANSICSTTWNGGAGMTVQILLDYCFFGSSGYEVHAIDLPFQGVYVS